MKAKKKKSELQEAMQEVGDLVLAKKRTREYPFKTKCKNCGHEDGMASDRTGLNHLVCFKCGKVGTTSYKRSKIMAKKKVKVKRAKAKRVKKAKTKKATHTVARAVGRNGLGVIATWVTLFKDNAREKLTDEGISKAIKKNFPGRESAIFDHVQAVRYRYNKGALTKGKTPVVESVRYGADGNVASARGKSTKKKVAKKKVVKKKKTKKVKRA